MSLVPEKSKKLLKEIGSVKPRLNFAFFPGKLRYEVIRKLAQKKEVSNELVKRLLESEDVIERRTGLRLIEDIKNMKPHLRKIAEDKDEIWENKLELARTLASRGENVVQILKDVLDDEEWKVKESEVEGLGDPDSIFEQIALARNTDVPWELAKILLSQGGREAEQMLERLVKERHLSPSDLDELRKKDVIKKSEEPKIETAVLGVPELIKIVGGVDFFESSRASDRLEKIAQDDFGLAKTLVNDKDSRVRRCGVNALKGHKEKALPLLKKLVKDKDGLVRYSVAEVSGTLGEEALSLLNRLMKDKDYYVKIAATKAQNTITGGYSDLLYNPKSLFATPFTKELVERVKILHKATTRLQKEFGDAFTGIIALGSTYMGTVEPGSDLDYAIIADDINVRNRFEELYKKLGGKAELCTGHWIPPEKITELKKLEMSNPLFSGLFFGDHKKLMRLQKDVLEELTDREWDHVRSSIFSDETGAFKYYYAKGRLRKDAGLEHVKGLQRTPPAREDTLKNIEEKVKRIGYQVLG